MGTVVALGGQFGGAKLADGLYRLRKKDLTVIVNTGDDFEHVGLAFSPDIDTLLYTLAGLENPIAGWEPQGETYKLFEMLKMAGGGANHETNLQEFIQQSEEYRQKVAESIYVGIKEYVNSTKVASYAASR